MAVEAERIVATVEMREDNPGMMKKLVSKFKDFSSKFKVLNGIMKAAYGIFRLNTTALVGLLFFGNQLSTMAKGLFAPVMDVFGVFDLWREMLVLLFLPAMEALFPYFLKLFEFVSNLPDGVKLVIGAFVAFVGVLGFILSAAAQLIIGFGALSAAFAGTGTAFAGVGSAITGIFAGITLAVAAVIAVILAIIVGFVLAWKDNFGRIREWVEVIFEGIKNIFRGLILVVGGVLQILFGLFTGNFDLIKKGFSNLVEGMKSFWNGIAQFINGVLVVIGLSVLKFVTFIIDKILGAVDWVWSKLKAMWGWATATGSGSQGTGQRGSSTGQPQNDFVWRPGQKPTPISPDDTLVGTKGGTGALGGVTVSPVYNITVADRFELERMMREHDRSLVDEIRRATGSRGA